MDLSSDNSKQQQNCCDNQFDLPDRPLSPVLSTGKKSKLFAFGSRQKRKSKVNLSTRFIDNPTNLECKANEIGSGDNENNANTVSKKPDTFTETTNTLEERIRNIKAIEDKRKEFYDTLCNIPTSNPISNTSDKFCFKKPVSPVCLQRKSITISSKPKLPLQPTNTEINFSNNKFEGFQTGTGKKIAVSDDAIKKHTELFMELFKDSLVSTHNESNTCKNVIEKAGEKQKPEGFQSASGKQINISTSALERASSLFSDENFDNSQSGIFLYNEPQKQPTKERQIVGKGTTNKSGEIRSVTCNRANTDNGNIGFSQESEFTDTQINFAVDTVESTLSFDVNSKAKKTEHKPPVEEESKSLQQEIIELQELLKKTVPELPRRKLRISQKKLKTPCLDSPLLSKEGDAYSNFAQSVVPDGTANARKLNSLCFDSPLPAKDRDAYSNFAQSVIPDATENMINNNKKDFTVKSLSMQVINDANLHCKNILSVISMVEKNMELNVNTDNIDSIGFSKGDIEFADNKAKTCENLVDNVSNRLSDVYYFGFTEKDKEFSLHCFQNGLDDIVDMNNKLIKDVADSLRTRGDSECTIEKEKSISSTEKSYDDLITLYKNKKRTNNNQSLPPRKRIKYATSSEDKTNDSDSLASDVNSTKPDFINKEKYTAMWCNSSFGAGCNQNKANLHSETGTQKSESVEIDKLHDTKRGHLKNNTDDVKPEFYFKSASGKNIGLSKESLKKAQQLFDDINNEEKGMPLCLANATETKEYKKKNNTNKPSAVIGFKSASNKIITISEDAMTNAKKLFDSVSNETNLTGTEKDGSYTDENISNIQQSSSKVKDIIEQIKESVVTEKLVHNVNTGFQNASGKNLPVSKDSVMKALSSYTKTEENESTLEVVEENQSLQNTPLKKHNLSLSNSNLGSKSAAKKRLGVSSLKQINIPSFKLERAKQLFAEADELIDNISTRKPVDTSTPFKPFQSVTYKNNENLSSPNILTVRNKQSFEFQNAVTPIKSSGQLFRTESSNSLITIQKETKGDVNSWLKNVEEECDYLEKQLNTLQQRKEALMKQKTKLEMKPTNRQG